MTPALRVLCVSANNVMIAATIHLSLHTCPYSYRMHRYSCTVCRTLAQCWMDFEYAVLDKYKLSRKGKVKISARFFVIESLAITYFITCSRYPEGDLSARPLGNDWTGCHRQTRENDSQGDSEWKIFIFSVSIKGSWQGLPKGIMINILYKIWFPITLKWLRRVTMTGKLKSLRLWTDFWTVEGGEEVQRRICWYNYNYNCVNSVLGNLR